ncbi:MAG: hypothetical protein ACJ8FC_09920 [Sphingomicrobium sp.]|jgi:hypothetical protein
MTAKKISTLSGQGSEIGLGIIFSSQGGYVWASWQEAEVSIRLGRHEMVATMMRDFLEQDALGERLSMRDLSVS